MNADKTKHTHIRCAVALAILTVIFGGCSTTGTKAPAPPIADTNTVSLVSGTDLAPPTAALLRQAESLRAYTVNRYIDPLDPDLLHEAHTVYRKENAAAWNLDARPPTPVETQFSTALAKQIKTLTAELSRLQNELAHLRAQTAANKQP